MLVPKGSVEIQASVLSLYLYDSLEPALYKVVSEGGTLDGQRVQSFGVGAEAVSGNSIAFVVRFEDNTEGLYVATIPEPSTLALLTIAALALTIGYWRRRRLA